MNATELEQLSRDVAKLEGIASCKRILIDNYDGGTYAESDWLYQDSARCFELMVKHKLDINHFEQDSVAYNDNDAIGCAELISNYNGDRSQATRVAILKARLAMGEIE